MQTTKEIWISGGYSMIVEIKNNLIRIVILDISGVYVQIHNQGYFDNSSINEIKKQYSDTEHWRVLVLD